MASISNDPGGRRRILFKLNGKRHSIRFGKVTAKHAETAKLHIEQLVSAAITGAAIDSQTSVWITKLPADIAAKLATAGLIASRKKKAVATLNAFVSSYIVGRSDVKDSTAISLENARRELVDFFGAAKPLEEITPADADAFRRHLTSRGEPLKPLADATARRRCGMAKQFFRAALRGRLIEENPFADMKGLSNRANRERDYFLTRGDAQKVLDACPNAQWRLIFALSRFGGLRCPSEHLALTWADIDWEKNRMTVHSPKTECHEGGECRIVPIFPELRPHLDAAFFQPGAGAYVVTMARDGKVNLRTQLERIIKRAGLTPWPKLFQNLRASRATELAAEYPSHVAAAWLGHSEIIANKHYRQVTDTDFERATTDDAAHKAAQRASAEAGGEQREKMAVTPSTRQTPTAADDRRHVQTCTVGGEGDELTSNLPMETEIRKEGGAQSGADLSEVVAAWPKLTAEARRAILAIIEGQTPA